MHQKGLTPPISGHKLDPDSPVLLLESQMPRRSSAERATPRLEYLDDRFYCKARRRRLTLDKCLSDYCTANAFERKKSACWRCPQGQINRKRYSAEVA